MSAVLIKCKTSEIVCEKKQKSIENLVKNLFLRGLK
jgi:hypothetical protein